MNEAARILVVDDEKQNRSLLRAMLKSIGYRSEIAVDGPDALTKVKLGPDLVLLDVMMPGMDGYRVTQRIREDPDHGHIPIVMVTVLTDKDDRLRAIAAGANGFITKPVDKTELSVCIESLLKMKRAQDEVRRDRAALKARLDGGLAALEHAYDDLTETETRTRKAYEETIHHLVLAAESKHDGTGHHVKRVGDFCAVLAQASGLPSDDVEILRIASAMHDVGKIGIPDTILCKPGPLTEDEREIMKTHTIIGAQILGGSSSPLLQAAQIIALSHHERWDAKGYPKGLAGEQIPLYGRICAVADVFDALTSDRVYRKAIPDERALEIIERGRGILFELTFRTP